MKNTFLKFIGLTTLAVMTVSYIYTSTTEDNDSYDAFTDRVSTILETNDEPKEVSDLEEVTLNYVIDGDTIIVANADDHEMKVRLIGIDTPESVHRDESKNTEEGVIASNYLTELIPEGTTLYLEKDTSDVDQYDRYLRYVWLSEIEDEVNIAVIKDQMLNGILLAEGYADVATYKPDVRYEVEFKTIIKE